MLKIENNGERLNVSRGMNEGRENKKGKKSKSYSKSNGFLQVKEHMLRLS